MVFISFQWLNLLYWVLFYDSVLSILSMYMHLIVYHFSSPLILIVGLVGWGLNMISFSFLFSTILRDKLAAVVFGYLIVLFGPIAGAILEANVFKIGDWRFKPLLLIFPLPLTEYFYTIATQCRSFSCMGIDAFTNNVEVQASLIAFYVDALLYFILGLYFDQVLPQPWGVQKDILFPISWIWKNRCKSASKKADAVSLDAAENMDEDVLAERKRVVENEATAENSSVLLMNLKKNYGKKKAVKGVHLSIPKTECFGLLGQNGAGKTSMYQHSNV